MTAAPSERCIGYSQNCRCSKCTEASQKCAVSGCHRKRHEDTDYCLPCHMRRAEAMVSHATCDNLLAIDVQRPS